MARQVSDLRAFPADFVPALPRIELPRRIEPVACSAAPGVPIRFIRLFEGDGAGTKVLVDAPLFRYYPSISNAVAKIYDQPNEGLPGASSEINHIDSIVEIRCHTISAPQIEFGRSPRTLGKPGQIIRIKRYEPPWER